MAMLKMAVLAVAVVGTVAGFVAYLVASNFAAASWAGIAAALALILAWDTWKYHRGGPTEKARGPT